MLQTCPHNWIPPMSRYGEALAECRELAGFEKQGLLATASMKLARDHPDLFQGFSQQWLSRLENDATGDAIRRAHPLKIGALAYLLGMSSTTFLTRIGVPIAAVPLREQDAPRQDEVSSQEYISEPVRGFVAAGQAFYSEENVLGREPVSREHWKRGMHVVKVSGDSMEPHLFAGDLLYVDTGDLDLQNNKLFLVQIGEGVVVKRARLYDDGEWYLVSDNTSYRPLKPDKASIIGRVFYKQPQGEYQ